MSINCENARLIWALPQVVSLEQILPNKLDLYMRSRKSYFKTSSARDSLDERQIRVNTQTCHFGTEHDSSQKENNASITVLFWQMSPTNGRKNVFVHCKISLFCPRRALSCGLRLLHNFVTRAKCLSFHNTQIFEPPQKGLMGSGTVNNFVMHVELFLCIFSPIDVCMVTLICSCQVFLLWRIMDHCCK